MRRRSILYLAAASAGTAGLSAAGLGKPVGATATAGAKPATPEEGRSQAADPAKERGMQLGAFSVSLAVSNLEASRVFYEKLGFRSFMGNASQNWLILKNGDHVIGLFQGMFDRNILTFNPGWDNNAQKLASFTDIRELQRQLKAQGVELVTEADETTQGPASFMVVDPDGNQILVDQHV